MTPGAMHYLIAVERPTSYDDGRGGREEGWSEVFRANAAIRFLRGGEVALAGRLAGKQPAVVTIWASAQARGVKTAWRLRDVRSGAVYNIRAIVPTDDRAMMEITCESGVAT